MLTVLLVSALGLPPRGFVAHVSVAADPCVSDPLSRWETGGNVRNFASTMAIAIKWPSPVTDDEIERLSRENPFVHFERSARGELLVSPPTGDHTDIQNAELTCQLVTWTKKNGEGVAVGSSAGFNLPDGALFSPDGAWIARERWKRIDRLERLRYAHICPDLVFELRSRSDSFDATLEKCAQYVRNGAQVAVALDPIDRLVEVHRPANAPQRFTDPETIECTPFDFVLDVRAIFDIEE